MRLWRQARHGACVFSWQAELWHWWYKAGQMFAWLKLVIVGQTESGLKMRLTCHYPDNKHTHVGTQRASPEQAQSAVGFPVREKEKIQEKKTKEMKWDGKLYVKFQGWVSLNKWYLRTSYIHPTDNTMPSSLSKVTKGWYCLKEDLISMIAPSPRQCSPWTLELTGCTLWLTHSRGGFLFYFIFFNLFFLEPLSGIYVINPPMNF